MNWRICIAINSEYKFQVRMGKLEDRYSDMQVLVYAGAWKLRHNCRAFRPIFLTLVLPPIYNLYRPVSIYQIFTRFIRHCFTWLAVSTPMLAFENTNNRIVQYITCDSGEVHNILCWYKETLTSCRPIVFHRIEYIFIFLQYMCYLCH